MFRNFLFFFALHILLMQTRSVLGKSNNKSIRAAAVGNGSESVDAELLLILTRHLNISMELMLTDSWGGEMNNAWSGVMGMVVNGSVDVGMSFLSITDSRARVVDFSSAVHFIEPIFFSRSPLPLPQFFNVLKPFPALGWALNSFTLLATLITFSIVMDNNPIPVWALVMQQGQNFRLGGLPSRYFAVLVLLIVATFGSFFYESNLRALLIAVDYEKAIDRAEDLIEQKRDFYFDKSSYVEYIMKASPHKAHQAITQMAIEGGNHYTWSQMDIMLEKIEKEGAAIVLPKTMGIVYSRQRLAKSNSNPFRLGRVPIIMNFCGFAFARGFQLQSELDEGLGWLVSNGIVQHVFDAFYPDLVEIKEDDSDIRINMGHLLLPNIALYCGLVMATLIFIIELKEKLCNQEDAIDQGNDEDDQNKEDTDKKEDNDITRDDREKEKAAKRPSIDTLLQDLE